jgi:trigger factor
MNVTNSLHDIDAVTKEIKISIPADVVGKECSTELTQLARTAKINGFRPGKAPAPMVEKLYGEQIFARVSQRLISGAISSAVGEHKLETVGYPEVSVEKLERGQQIDVSAKVALRPRPKVAGYDEIPVSVKKRDVADEDVQKSIDAMRERRASLKKLESRNTVQMGDVVDATLALNVQDEAPSKAEPFVQELGKGRLPKEVEEQLVGLEVGGTRTIPHTHAEGGPAQLSGKTADYVFNLNSIYEKVLPELNDEFAKESALDAQTVSELKSKVRERLEGDAQKEAESEVQTAVLEELLKRNEFEVPQAMVDYEIKGLLMRSGLLDTRKVDIDQISAVPFRDALGETAKKRAKIEVMVDQIAAQEGVKLEPSEVDAEIDAFAKSANVTREQMEGYLRGGPGRMEAFVGERARDKVLKLLVSRAKVTYEKAPTDK